ncbi:hypothetical protein Pint_02868 [Pistacia integerrima]|uniref:Uncharacterized protein n=1 Tax=Pistacia integerrima TaxID=434235 RepID=A0ACC0ZEQ2_9ROSI|nr:hypothetical protein Pint_02868 [Pistacia integerrima]
MKIINVFRRNLAYLSCGTGNPIDDYWSCDPNWERNRQSLANCATGFGKNAIGGRNSRIYVVTDSSNDDPVNPKPGTLRYAVIQYDPLWIIFKRDMVIQLKQELVMNSFKTIAGRGANVHITLPINHAWLFIMPPTSSFMAFTYMTVTKEAMAISETVRSIPGGGLYRTTIGCPSLEVNTFGLTIARYRTAMMDSSMPSMDPQPSPSLTTT